MKRSPALRELLIVGGFLALTVLMTWPWVLHLRNSTNDRVDSYAHAYFLWWDYHQTVHDPLHLFQATIFYPYHDTLAFGESDYGISLIFFPLFALGVPPLMVHGVAILVGFAFSGYGMFRLARTLSASAIVAWTAGIVFAFIPYRFGQLDRLQYLFSAWIPLLFEALILFIRERSWKRGVWLGVAFCMNTLTCLTWFVLTLAPLICSAVFLITRQRLWRERKLWLRGATVLGAAALVLAPFMLPFYRVSKMYGFARTRADVTAYAEIHLGNWLAMGGSNKLWQGMSAGVNPTSESALFPGFVPLFLILTLIFLIWPLSRRNGEPHPGFPPRLLLSSLDAIALLSLFIALLATGYGAFTWRVFGFRIFSVSKPVYPLIVLALAVVVRWSFALPKIVRAVRQPNWLAAVRSAASFEPTALASIWLSMGFFGSFGFSFIFHRVLFNLVPLFRSMRVPARWSMICYLGLALLAGMAASGCAELLAQRFGLRKALTCIVIIAAILFEQRAAPLALIRGEADPDLLSLRLRQTPMAGGIVDLPAGPVGTGNQRYMLRAADHGRPIVVATNSFMPPIENEIEELTRKRPIPERLLDLFETIPASYLVVHQTFLSPESRLALQDLLARETTAGRLRFIRRYDYREGDGLTGYNDLYAVVKVEPFAKSEADVPPLVSYRDYQSRWWNLPPEFGESGYLIYRLYKASFGRAPTFAEFMGFVGEVNQGIVTEKAKTLAEEFTRCAAFKVAYDDKTNDQFVDELFANIGIKPGHSEREALVQRLNDGAETRSAVLHTVADEEAFLLREFDAGLVLMNYFAYLRRDPDQSGYDFWLSKLDESGDYGSIIRAFSSSYEHQLGAAQPWP